MKTMLLVTGLAASVASAQPVKVTVTGEVEYNQINGGVLGAVQSGETATITMMLDASVFTDSPNFPVRGYEVLGFEASFDSGSLGLQEPYPGTAYFSVRNDDPAVDGFLLTEVVDFPVGVQLDQEGVFGQFVKNFYVTYTGETLDSVNIEDAYGVYDFTNLTVFNWTVDDGPFNPMGMLFQQMVIEPAGCAGDFNGDGELNILDFVAYQNAFTAGDASADCDGNGSLNILDFVCFQNLFQAGC